MTWNCDQQVAGQITIVTDSTTDIPEGMAEQYGIVVLPLYVIIEGKEYLDSVEISTNEVYAFMRRDIVPKTAQINYADTEDTLREHLEAREDLIYIGFSSKMSGTYQLVAGILEDLQEEYPDRRMSAIDSRGGSLATGIITLRAAEDARRNADFDRLTARIHEMVSNIEHVFGITHADDIDAAEKMKALIKTRLPDCSFMTMEIGPVLGVHIGIGGVGVFF